MHAYSRLKTLLKYRHLSVPELHRQIRRSGLHVNVKSLYRLSDDEQPLERLDMRIAGAICRACDAPLSEWIVFEEGEGRLRTMSEERQSRLESLMASNSAGELTEDGRRELRELVREAEEITLGNARLLAAQHDRLRAPRSEKPASEA